MFVGSPIETTSEEMVTIGKRLRKYGIAVDVINFGETEINEAKLEAFIEAVNNNDNR